MKANEAKKIIKQYLDGGNIPYTKLTARTIDFTDLMRAKRIFVKIYGWIPGEYYVGVKTFARHKNISLEFSRK